MLLRWRDLRMVIESFHKIEMSWRYKGKGKLGWVLTSSQLHFHFRRIRRKWIFIDSGNLVSGSVGKSTLIICLWKQKWPCVDGLSQLRALSSLNSQSFEGKWYVYFTAFWKYPLKSSNQFPSKALHILKPVSF